MSNFKKIMEASINGQLNKVAMPTPNLNKRKMSLEEVKALVGEEFEKAKDACDTKAKEVDDGWGKAELEKEMNWMKILSIKEWLINKSVK